MAKKLEPAAIPSKPAAASPPSSPATDIPLPSDAEKAALGDIPDNTTLLDEQPATLATRPLDELVFSLYEKHCTIRGYLGQWASESESFRAAFKWVVEQAYAAGKARVHG